MSLIENLKKFSNEKGLLAINSGKTKLSYYELFKNIEIVSSNLSSYNEKIVIILCNKKIESYILILSCILLKKTYIPISENTPKKKIEKIIKFTKSNFIVSTATKKKFNIKNNINFVQLLKKTKKSIKINSKNNIAYIIFTSGTTGNPKGVCISYKSLEHYLRWIKNKKIFKKGEKISQFSSLSFDLSVVDFLGGLYQGCEIFPIQDQIDKFFYLDFLIKNKIEAIVITPSTSNLIIKSKNFTQKNLRYLKKIFFCGEPLLKNYLNAFFKKNKKLQIFNTYGPTETTVSVSYLKLNNKNFENYDDKYISIGRPIKNINFKILRKNKNIGELLIAGPQNFIGYLNNKKMDSLKTLTINKKKYYKTNDLFFKKNNNYYFLSRNDDQIKKNGFRIELSEINECILKIKKISFAYSIFKKDKIITFIKKDKIIDNKNILNYVKKNIETYKVPDKLININHVPLNNNKKIDIKFLNKIANV